MNEPSHKPSPQRRKRLWQALAGSAVFLAVGLLMIPGIIGREPAPREHVPARSSFSGDRTFDGIPRPAASSFASGESTRTGAAPASSPAEGGRGFDCMIVPSEVVDLGSPITGRLDEITVERGDYVEAGQVVAKLESRVEEAAVAVARARAERTDDIESSRTNLDLSRKRLTRARGLFDRNVLSLNSRQEIEAEADLATLQVARAEEDHRVAKLQLAQAEADLERRTIRAPVSGVVTERLMSAGEVVDEETVLRIARVDPLRVEAILPVDWFGRVGTGDRAEIVPEQALGPSRDAEVVIVDPVLDGASGTFGVQLDLPNADRRLPAGLRCEVRFREQRARKLAGEQASTARVALHAPPEVSALAPPDPLPSENERNR